MKTPEEILRELVAIPSTSSMSNRSVIDWITNFLQPLGWYTRTFPYTDADGVEKLNLIASLQPLDATPIYAELAMVCHTDTVPYGSDWPDATHLREQDGMLHGCGACDVKGFLSCMLAAAQTIHAPTLNKTLCMAFTSDEEIGCKGARSLHEQKVFNANYAIIGEPTSLVPARAGKGYCLAEAKIHGKSAHSAYPEQGSSAIIAAGHLLVAIDAIAEQLKSDRNEAFTPAWTTINVGVIRGGTAKNIVPAECTFLVEWRPIPNQHPELVFKVLQMAAAKLSVDGITIDIDLLRMDTGFETPLDSPVVRATKQQPHTPVLAVAFGTEAPWLARMGAQAVVIGPGSMLTAHSPRECVPKKELDDCVQLLHQAIEVLCR